MRRLGSQICLLIFLVPAVSVGADDCDCTITPFKPEPPCFKECSAKLLRALEAADIELFAALVDLPADFVAEVASSAKQQKIESLDELEEDLGARTFKKLERKLRRATNRENRDLLTDFLEDGS